MIFILFIHGIINYKLSLVLLLSVTRRLSVSTFWNDCKPREMFISIVSLILQKYLLKVYISLYLQRH